MNDDELRLLIRSAIQKHLGAGGGLSAVPSAPVAEPRRDNVVTMSFGQYRLERAADDTMCLIEPAVQCNHCGFCKCHGH